MSKLTYLWYFWIFEINVMHEWYWFFYNYYEAKLLGGIIFIIVPALYLIGNITYAHFINKTNSNNGRVERVEEHAIKFILGTLIAFLCSIALTFIIRILVRMLVTLFTLLFFGVP